MNIIIKFKFSKNEFILELYYYLIYPNPNPHSCHLNNLLN